MTVAGPSTLGALVESVSGSAPAPLQIVGAGTKRLRPRGDLHDDALLLDVRDLRGITAYDPAECVVTALAGTPVADVRAALAGHGQCLPFDPPFSSAGATIGGLVASGVNGPCRLRYGGVRDFVIGARVVDGRGRLIASGGQVVKNAAGFLTHHALVGSAGRLGAIAEVSFKVFPHAEARATLVARAPSLAEALAAHERLRQANLDLEALDLDVTCATVAVRVAGAARALPHRVDRAGAALGVAAEHLTGEDDARLWSAAAEFAWASGATVVKLPTAPSRLTPVLDTCAALGPCRVSVAGAVVYLATAGALDEVHARLLLHGWSGVVIRGEAHGRRLGAAGGAVFADRVRATLDPDGRFV